MSREVTLASFICPECGRSFDSPQGLSGHKMSHRDVLPCPECGQTFNTPASKARHRASQHGVPLKSTGTTSAVNGRRSHIPKLSEWEADDILETVVSAMFPGGSVPNTALMPLIRWREATRQLIEDLQTQT